MSSAPLFKNLPTLLRSGVYVTRNKETYLHGRMWLNYNRAYNNGINGLVVHKTDRAHVVGNVLWDNGQVSRYVASKYFFKLKA